MDSSKYFDEIDEIFDVIKYDPGQRLLRLPKDHTLLGLKKQIKDVISRAMGTNAPEAKGAETKYTRPTITNPVPNKKNPGHYTMTPEQSMKREDVFE